MAELPEGYRAISEADQKKADSFFERARSVANTGNYEYSIEMYLQGLAIDPENVDAHQSLRDIALNRKLKGGKDLGFMEKMKLKRSTKDEKQDLLNAEKLLSYDPGNMDHMVAVLQAAHKGGYYDTVLWIGGVLFRANTDAAKPEFNKFIILKDVYKSLQQWKLASDAARAAAEIRPENTDLAAEMKNLAVEHTMSTAKYGTARSFRESVRDMERQRQLLEQERGITSTDSLTRAVQQAEVEYEVDPNEPGKLLRLVDALTRTERPEDEERAIQLLRDAYQKTSQFRFRLREGQIKLAKLVREERALLAELRADPSDPVLRKRVQEFARSRAETGLEEYRLAAENYPSNLEYRFHMAVRLYTLGRFNEAIPLFQQSRNDPKLRIPSSVNLGRAFLDAGFVDEAIETLREVIQSYEIRGDDRSKDMHYWYGRALESRGDTANAIKAYSQVAQWDFNFRDTQARMKQLRGGAAGNGGGSIGTM